MSASDPARLAADAIAALDKAMAALALDPATLPPDQLVEHGGRLMPRAQLKMCGSCPKALYAFLAWEGRIPHMVFFCEDCDGIVPAWRRR